MEELKMREKRGNGILLSFCGLDGSGKSTMIRRLATELCSKGQVLLTKQPTDAVRNSEIFRNFMDCSDHSAYDYRSLSLLAASDRLQHTNKVIEPAIAKGDVVLTDRYFYSCLANLRARGYSDDRWIYEIAEHMIKPDVAFFFDLPVDMAIERVRSRAAERDRYIDVGFQEKLRQEYIDICHSCQGILVPTDISEEESYEIVKREVERIII